MRNFAVVASMLMLAGCAGNLKLLEDGKAHPGSWNAATKELSATVDGKLYKGKFTQQASVGFGQGFGTAFGGNRPPAYGSAFGTTVSSNGMGQAVLTSEDGKVIQCVFQAQMGRGQGQCEALDGRRFVLVIGG